MESAGVLDAMSRARVPHCWFLHFYVVSTLSSLFWLWQYVSGTALLLRIVTASGSPRQTGMSLKRVHLLWFMMAVQGVRRLYESIAFSKPSSSKMWVAHYLIGIMFYLITNVAIWVEGCREFKRSHDLPPQS